MFVKYGKQQSPKRWIRNQLLLHDNFSTFTTEIVRGIARVSFCGPKIILFVI